MRVTDVKVNHATQDVSVHFSGGRSTLVAKALQVEYKDNSETVRTVTLDRLIPKQEKLESREWLVSGCYVSVLTAVS